MTLEPSPVLRRVLSQCAAAKAFPLGGRWHGEAVTDEGVYRQRAAPRDAVGSDALIAPVIAVGNDAAVTAAGGIWECLPTGRV